MKNRRALLGLLIILLIILLIPSVRDGLGDLAHSLLTVVQWVIGGLLGIAAAALIFGVGGVKRR